MNSPISIVPGNPLIPETTGDCPATSAQDVESAVAELASNKAKWAKVDIAGRIALLDRIIADVLEVADDWAAAGIRGRQLPTTGPLPGEEYILGPWPTVRCARLYRDTLAELLRTGTLDPGKTRTLPNGQVAARVFPSSLYDAMLFVGTTAEIWMEPGVTEATLADTMAQPYRGEAPEPKVALVLGAGNVTAISSTDVLHKLLVENQVVVLKMNPVNDYAGPFIAKAFRGLIDAGFLRVVYGGIAEGTILSNHADVDEIHLTGSDKTHDAIVFGPGPEGLANKVRGSIVNRRRVTCELGNVSPVIIVPGPWQPRDHAQQGEAIASQITANVGFNCITARVVINHRSWDQRGQLLDAARTVLKAAPPRHPYYPGARERFDRFAAAHPDKVETFGSTKDGAVPWTMITGVDAADTGDIVFTSEAFTPLFAETTLEAGSVVEYIDRAVAFANEHLWGTLGAGIIVHPRSLKDPAVADAVERAIRDLRYGNVTVNSWTGLSFLLMTGHWGAFPGHDAHDIQSGTGWVHNTRMFGKPQKTVLRGPFHPMVKPAWFPSHRTADRVGKLITRFDAAPSWLRLPALTVAAMRG